MFHFPIYLALHIPDGYLSFPVNLATWAIAIVLVIVSVIKIRQDNPERVITLMGVMSAFIFACQMVNFPIPNGTSGHLLGGTLAGIILGPWASSVVMAVVISVQAIVFQDGGMEVLGANICNMGLLATLGGYWLYRQIRFAMGRNGWTGMLTGTVVASWLSVVLGAIATALQISWSGTVPLDLVLPAMLGWHIQIGVGEALLTAIAVSIVWRWRPDLFFDPPTYLLPENLESDSHER
jgi:cobalt/nickel transport system permease protein